METEIKDTFTANVHPHGMIYLLASSFNDVKGFTNPAARGVRMRPKWNEIEPVEGLVDWSAFDRAVANCAKNQKQLGVSVGFGINTPDWLKAKVQLVSVTEPKVGTMPKLDDPVAIAAEIAFIKTYGARYNGKFSYIVMGGFGQNLESYYNVGTGTAADIAGWTSACDQLIPVYMTAFPNTAVIMVAAKPFKTRDGEVAIRAVVDKYAKKYPGHFGVMDAGLSANSTAATYAPHELVQKYSATNPNGLQFLTSGAGFGGMTLGGTLKQTLQAGLNLKAHFIEAYAGDLDDPANAALFNSYSTLLPR